MVLSMKCKVHHFKTFLSKLYFNMSYMLVVNTCCVVVIQPIFVVYLMIYIYIYIYIYILICGFFLGGGRGCKN